MRKRLTVAIAFAWLTGQWLAPCACQAAEDAAFRPARAVSISDITIPVRSVANGTAVLEVTVSKEGEVRNLRVRRDIPSETEEAIRAVRTWKFQPARFNGKAVASRVTVAVTFNPSLLLSVDRSSLPPRVHEDQDSGPDSGFSPPEVIHAAYPTSPFDALSPGTVVLEESLDQAGNVHRTKVLRDAPPFTNLSVQALDDWKFTPATMNGRPVASKVILVFCFRQPLGWWSGPE